MEQTTIKTIEAIQLPIEALRTALSCALVEKVTKKEPNQKYPYLNGVYVHAKGGEYRVVATDMHRVFVYSTPAGDVVPEWATEGGVIIPRDGLSERLQLLDKLHGETAKLAYADGAPYVVMSDPADHAVFNMRPIRHTFPDYQATIDRLSMFEAREVGDMESSAIQAGYLKQVGMFAKMLGADTVRIFSGGPNDAKLVLFPGNDHATLILMPVRLPEGQLQIGSGAASVLSGSVATSVAALRAHQTRWRNKPGKAAEKKVAEYDKRIAAMLAAVNAVPALPAPEPKPEEPQSAEVVNLMEALKEAVTAEPAQPEGEAADVVAFRKGLSPAKRVKDRTRFIGAVDGLLKAEHGGLSVHQLADGVPIDDWYEAGCTPSEAATRCLDWRRIGSVLPPDEVKPGEADLPVGLLQSEHRNGKEPEAEATGDEPAAEAEADAEAPSEEPGDEPATETEAEAEATEAAKPTPARDAKFEAFCKQVDAIIQKRKGVSLDDLVDCPMRDWFDAKNSPATAARKAIRFNEQS